MPPIAVVPFMRWGGALVNYVQEWGCLRFSGILVATPCRTQLTHILHGDFSLVPGDVQVSIVGKWYTKLAGKGER